MTSEKFLPVIIVTGLSGAGKSTALNVFEDLGFFCVDGLPASMVSRLVNLFHEENPINYRGLALGMDIRQHGFLKEWKETLSKMAKKEIHPLLIFLQAQTDALLLRYATTRRPHPLEAKDMGLEAALEQEWNLLQPLRQEADLILDTTDFSIHDLRRHLQEKWDFLSITYHGLRIHVVSFGYKYGIPKEADLVFDLRFLPNPFFENHLSSLSGQEEEVSEYVLSGEPGSTFMQKLTDFLSFILPLYTGEGRYRLTLAFGCTGGRHRSVAIAIAVYRILVQERYQVSLEHRHLELG